MEAKRQHEVTKCPHCSSNIHYLKGRFPGGINDYGGWILECQKCHKRFPFDIQNPKNASSIHSGAIIIDSWDNEIPESKELAMHGINTLSDSLSVPSRVAVIESGEKDLPKFDAFDFPLYLCPKCEESVEARSYEVLSENLDSINSSLQSFLTPYLKGYENHPDSVIVSQEFTCNCGETLTSKFYKKFVESKLLISDINDLLLVDIPESRIDIDGVYTRDHCFGILDKLLIRWSALHNVVLLVVPFIGFDFKNAEKKRIELWNRVLKYTTPEKTAIITRKATFTSFKEAAENQGLDLAFLKDYDLLNQTIVSLDEKDALFKRDFHAKFYCGMSGSGVEVLTGSFNIHEGSYVENIHLKQYEVTDFFKRYIINMSFFFNPQLLIQEGYVLQIKVQNQKATYKTENYNSSLWDFVKLRN